MAKIELEKVGPLIEHDAAFPDGVNAEFVEVIFENEIKRPAAGQSVVFYNETECLGGGIIA